MFTVIAAAILFAAFAVSGCSGQKGDRNEKMAGWWKSGGVIMGLEENGDMTIIDGDLRGGTWKTDKKTFYTDAVSKNIEAIPYKFSGKKLTLASLPTHEGQVVFQKMKGRTEKDPVPAGYYALDLAASTELLSGLYLSFIEIDEKGEGRTSFEPVRQKDNGDVFPLFMEYYGDGIYFNQKYGSRWYYDYEYKDGILKLRSENYNRGNPADIVYRKK